ELLDPTPRADRLVVDLRARLDLLEVLEPLLVDRIGEGRPGAGQCRSLEPPATRPAAAGAAAARDRDERDRKRERPRSREPPCLPHPASPPRARRSDLRDPRLGSPHGTSGAPR